MIELKNKKIAVIGLGYVGLPLAVAFSKNGFEVLGYDINADKIDRLKAGIDDTTEIDAEDIAHMRKIEFSANTSELGRANVYFITVPTPIDESKRPNLRPLLTASNTVGKHLNTGDLVIYESTVYPGCTEEDCVPELEAASGLKLNVDFFCGYSPERINPGDKKRKIHNIVRVTSGSNTETADLVDQLYNAIIEVGTHKVSSIKVAEASKIIENTQRDLNISLVNEFALIFDRLKLDTVEILEAAGTKWNFLPFRPGLVGGHCIGVDPYYLTHKAESVGYHPQVILSGRRINDNMGVFIASKVIKLMVKNDLKVNNSRILVLGITFKENCSDIRNSRVIDLIRELQSFGAELDVCDPNASNEEVLGQYGIHLLDKPKGRYDAIILAVGHDQFAELSIQDLRVDSKSVVFDIKSFFPKNQVTARL